MSEAPRTAFEIITLFPAAVEAFAGAGLLGKAIERGLVAVHTTSPRDFATDRWRTVDDAPFGGGAGMVLKPEPVVAALEHVVATRGPCHRILLTPSAPRFDQRVAERLATLPRIALVCGRYEGIDDRVREHYVDECLSLGDFVLGGGEVAALAIVEAVSRLAEGVLHNPESVAGDSFAAGDHGPLLEFPQYTRPAVFREHAVPEVLLSGDHAAVAAWRLAASLRRTWALRPELRAVSPWPPALPISLGVGADAIALAPALAELARCHALAGLVVLGGDEDDALAWTRATGGRVPIAAMRDLAAVRRRLKRSEAGAPWLVALAAAGEVPAAAASAAELHDRLTTCAGRRGAAVLLLPGLAGAQDAADAIFAPAAGAHEGSPAAPQRARVSEHDPTLANPPAIVDPSRPAALAVVELALTRLRGTPQAPPTHAGPTKPP
ncbi:MAG: tRNA (guanosine(37)-N1)-methyltransferase TrmD [Nannocystaceae bacterium]|nr:tRNA (guanosine(37)-N1)-methyltransferase TrmD [Nannocystaceae bacterium]